MNEVLRSKPIYQQRVWGGRNLESKLGRILPPDEVIGESWEWVDRPEAQSIIEGGSCDGLSLRETITRHSAAIMGPDWNPNRPFPILMKWLDCQERLSLQVHPPAEVAKLLGGEPKTEAWYVADASPDAALICGLKKGVTREQFVEALEQNDLERWVHRVPVGRGFSTFTPSGRIHAIDAGNLILEIQQNSDTTYRVYDWGRVGLDGQPRQLHIQESLQSINFHDYEPAPLAPSEGTQLIADADVFRIQCHTLHPEHTVLSFPGGEEPRILSVVEGELREETLGIVVGRGENVILPYAAAFRFIATRPGTALVTDHFNQTD
jgi:mannose-6-phosphate isomerase